jgi:hypothetical protein
MSEMSKMSKMSEPDRWVDKMDRTDRIPKRLSKMSAYARIYVRELPARRGGLLAGGLVRPDQTRDRGRRVVV